MKFVIAVALAIGCSSSSSSEAPAPTTGSAAAKEAPRDGLQLLSAGDPKTARALRYHLVKGTQSFVELEMAIEAGRPTPRMKQKLEIDVEDVASDGSARVRTTIVEARILVDNDQAGQAPMFAEMARTISGLGFTAKLMPNGKLVESKLVNADQLPPPVRDQVGQLTQGIEQVAMPLPEQPVGLGAKWSTRRPIKQVGIEMVSVTTTEITAIDNDTISFKSTSTVTGADQATKLQGVAIEVKDIGGGGVASGTVDLTRMTMTGSFELEFRGSMTAMGQTTPMKTKMTLAMKPADAPPSAETKSGSGSGSAAKPTAPKTGH
jgi:hypothetical protein